MIIKRDRLYSNYLKRYVSYSFHEEKDSDIFIYFFDGANLYDVKESFIGEVWGLDKALALLGLKANLVGVYAKTTSKERYEEYSPFKTNTLAYKNMDIRPRGIATGKFLVRELMPIIEAEKNVKSRLIAGSSMGAVMSLYMGSTYPEIFGKVLAMSTHFLINPEEMGQIIGSFNPKNKQKVYLDVGKNERASKEKSTLYLGLSKMASGILRKNVDLKFIVDEKGVHSENSRARRLPRALAFLFETDIKNSFKH